MRRRSAGWPGTCSTQGMTIHSKPMAQRGPDVACEIRVVYVLRSSRQRAEFLTLMSELRTVTENLIQAAGASASGYSMTERADRDGWFIETLKFASDDQRSRFDDLYCADRRATALQA